MDLSDWIMTMLRVFCKRNNAIREKRNFNGLESLTSDLPNTSIIYMAIWEYPKKTLAEPRCLMSSSRKAQKEFSIR